MNRIKKSVPILIADDDEEDREMVRDALKESRLANNLHCVKDGEELMDYLHHRGKFEDPIKNPLPGLILLDLNMPRMGGKRFEKSKLILTCGRYRSSFLQPLKPRKIFFELTNWESILS